MKSKLLIALAAAILLPIGLWAALPDLSADESGAEDDYLVKGPEIVLWLPWGSSGYAAGRLDGDEAASEGPMSFTVAADNRVYLLDQVNRRVLRFHPDGSLERVIPIPSPTFHDLEVTEEGTLVLLDRFVQRALVLVDEAGTVLAEHPVEGFGVPEAGLITAVFARDDGVWLEYGHAHVVRVLDALLQPCDRDLLPGRLFPGRRVSLGVGIDGQGGARVWLKDLATGELRAEADLILAHRIDRIIWIAADEDGYVHVLVHVLEFDPEDPRRVTVDEVVGVLYDEELNELGTFETPHTITRWDQFREVYVTPGGAVYQLAFEEDGAALRRWSWKW